MLLKIRHPFLYAPFYQDCYCYKQDKQQHSSFLSFCKMEVVHHVIFC